MNTEASERNELFWELAEALYTNPAVTRSTMMGFPCLRINGGFFACVERSTGNLIVKLPADRVNELVATGIPFAPNGKVFREWIAFPIPDEDEWAALRSAGLRRWLTASPGSPRPVMRSSPASLPAPSGVAV